MIHDSEPDDFSRYIGGKSVEHPKFFRGPFCLDTLAGCTCSLFLRISWGSKRKSVGFASWRKEQEHRWMHHRLLCLISCVRYQLASPNCLSSSFTPTMWWQFFFFTHTALQRGWNNLIMICSVCAFLSVSCLLLCYVLFCHAFFCSVCAPVYGLLGTLIFIIIDFFFSTKKKYEIRFWTRNAPFRYLFSAISYKYP
jgi:hypothetical protein